MAPSLVVISNTDYVIHADGEKILKISEIDNTPTANSNNPVKSGGVKTAIDALDVFQYGEVKTGAKWINGKPIYRKGIGGLFGGGTGSWNTTGGTITNVDTMVRAWACRTTDKTIINSMSFQLQGTTVYYFNPPNAPFTGTDLIFIEYTKTTD